VLYWCQRLQRSRWFYCSWIVLLNIDWTLLRVISADGLVFLVIVPLNAVVNELSKIEWCFISFNDTGDACIIVVDTSEDCITDTNDTCEAVLIFWFITVRYQQNW
jgi:hypothetical protein